MTFHRAGLFLIAFGIVLGSENALACGVVKRPPAIPMKVVANAEVILRVTAFG